MCVYPRGTRTSVFYLYLAVSLVFRSCRFVPSIYHRRSTESAEPDRAATRSYDRESQSLRSFPFYLLLLCTHMQSLVSLRSNLNGVPTNGDGTVLQRFPFSSFPVSIGTLVQGTVYDYGCTVLVPRYRTVSTKLGLLPGRTELRCYALLATMTP